jgi:hypothetical protein
MPVQDDFTNDFVNPTSSKPAETTEPADATTKTENTFSWDTFKQSNDAVTNNLNAARQARAEQRELFKEEAAVVDPRMTDNNQLLRGGVTGAAMLTGKVSQHFMRSNNLAAKTIGGIGAGVAGTLGFVGDAVTQQATAGEVDWGQATQHGLVAAVGGGAIAGVGQKLHNSRVAINNQHLDTLIDASKATGSKINDLKAQAQAIIRKNPKDKTALADIENQIKETGQAQADVKHHFAGITGSKKADHLQKEALAKIDAGKASDVDYLDLQKKAAQIKLSQEKAAFRKQLNLSGTLDPKNGKDRAVLDDIMEARFPKDPMQIPYSDKDVREALLNYHKGKHSLGNKVRQAVTGNPVSHAVTGVATNPVLGSAAGIGAYTGRSGISNFIGNISDQVGNGAYSLGQIFHNLAGHPATENAVNAAQHVVNNPSAHHALQRIVGL